VVKRVTDERVERDRRVRVERVRRWERVRLAWEAVGRVVRDG
jgi:hypothetical protein